MKNCAKKSLKTLSSLFAASLLFCFSSCEIGLGATVDVEKPTVSITYPPTSSIIRDSFILAGTCSDDRELKSIEVEIVKNKNGKEIFVSKTVYEDIITLKGDGTAKNATWKVELNTPVDGKYPLTDGKYTFKVKSFDATNRESMQSSRTVEIDNTAPVFVIKNPGSIDDVESYGSIFTLKGVIKEEHTISYMKLIVYNENKQDITSVLNGTTAEWIENDVEEDVNIIVARFNTDVEDNLHERYASIYGTESAGIKNYYTSIIVGDNAGVYKTENYDDSDVSSDSTDDEFTGNHTSSLWLNDAINGDDAGENNILGSNNKAYHKRQYYMTDILKILNGTYEKTNKESDEDINKVREVLENCRTDTIKTQLPISLNKDANPTYQFNGYSFTGNEIENKSVYSNSTVTLKADCGLDGINFYPNKIKVYLFGPYSAEEFTEAEIKSVYEDVTKYYEKELKKGEDGKALKVYDFSKWTGSSKDSWTNDNQKDNEMIQLPKLKSNLNYLLALTGTDTNGVPFVRSGGYYGFTAKSSGNPPSVSILTPDADTVSKEENVLKVSGTAYSEEGDQIVSVTYEVQVVDLLNKNKILGTVTGEADIADGYVLGVDSSLEWSFDISEGDWSSAEGVNENGDNITSPVAGDGKNYKYNIKVIGMTEKQGTDTVSVQLDRKKPEVKIGTPSPYAKSEVQDASGSADEKPVTLYYVNGKITIPCTVSDVNLSKSSLLIYDENDKLQKEENLEANTYVSVQIDTEEITDSFLKMKIVLESEDTAGNIERSTPLTNYIIDQSTDNPVIKVIDTDVSVSSVENVSKNLFDNDNKGNIQVFFSDDDKISSYKIEYSRYKEDSSDEWKTLVEEKNISSSTYLVSAELKEDKKWLEEGIYKIRVRVSDEKDDGSDPKTIVLDPFLIAIDAKNPDFSIDNKSDEYYFEGEQVVITGTAADTSGISRVVRVVTDENEQAVSYSGENGTWKDTVTIGKTSSKISYKAYDNYNKSSNVTFNYLVDDADPELKVEVPSSSSVFLGAASGNSTKAFSGKADDTGSVQSGIKEVIYRIITTDSDGKESYIPELALDSEYDKWSKISDVASSWSVNIELGNGNGSKKVQFVAVDKAGRYSLPVERTVIVDASSPVIEIQKIEDSLNAQEVGRTVTASEGTYFVQSGFKVTGKVTEEYIYSFKNKSSNNDIPVETDGSFSFTVQNPSNGQQTITLEAVDEASQRSSVNLNIYLDTENPIPNLSVSPVVIANSKDNNVNGSITLKATSVDDDKVVLSRIRIIDLDDENKVVVDVPTQNPTTINRSVSLTDCIAGTTLGGVYEISSGLIKDKNLYSVELISTDRSGRTGKASIEVYLDQSTDKPIVNLSNTDYSASSVTDVSKNKNLFNSESNNKILGTVTDDDGIKSILIEYAPVTENSSGADGSSGTTGSSVSTGVYKTLLNESGAAGTSLGTTYNLSAELKDSEGNPLSEGKYKIRITVLDITESAENHKTVHEFYIGIDNGSPLISVSTSSGYQTAEFTVTGSASDAALCKILRYKTKLDESGKRIKDGLPVVWEKNASSNHINYNPATKVWTDLITVSAGGTILYIAEDEYGQSTEVTWSYLYDNTPPTVAPLWTSGDMSAWTKNTAHPFEIPVSDYWDVTKETRYDSCADIASVSIYVDGNSVSAMALGNLYKGENNSSVYSDSYNYYSSTQILSDGTHTVTVTAKDKVDNVSDVLATWILNIDTKSPKYTPYTEGGTDYVKASKTLLTKKDVDNLEETPFTLKITASDANASAHGGKVSGISGFKVFRGTDDISSLAAVRTGTSPSSSVAEAVNGVFADGTYYIHLAPEALITGTHTFYVEVSDNAGNSLKTGTSAVSIDVTSPEMSWNVPGPYVTVNGERKYNGIITVSGTVNDETELASDDTSQEESTETRSVSWEVKTSGGESLVPPVKGYASLSGTKTSAFSFELDTTKVQTESGSYRIYITAKDKVGNTVSATTASENYIEFSIDQSTNKPKLSLSNMNIYVDMESETPVKVTSYDEANKGRNLFGMGSNVIYGTVSDDDGISSIVLKIDGTEIKKTVSGELKPYFSDLSGNPTSYTMQIDLSTINSGEVIASGNHTLSIEVKDSSSNSLTDKKYIENKDTVNGIYFAYDNDLPVISVVRCNDKDYTNNMWGKGEFDVYIQVSDASDSENGKGLSLACTEIKRSADGSSAASYSAYTPHNSNNEPVTETIEWSTSKTFTTGDETVTLTNAWKCPTVNEAGYFQRTYNVSDKYGRSTTTTINYIVDTEAPEFNNEYLTVQGTSNSGTTAIKVGDLTSSTWFRNSAIKISGTGSSYTENDTAIKEQNMESLVITVGSGSDAQTVNANTSTNNKFNTTIEFSEGEGKKFKFTAADKAGNTTLSGEFSINVDTVAPTGVSADLKKADGTTAIADNSIINDETVKLSVSAADATSGIKKVYIGKTPGFLTSAAIASDELSTVTGSYSKTLELKIGDKTAADYLADGTHSLYIRVEDLAGNITDGSTAVATFTVDRTAPSVTITSPVRATVIDNEWTIKGTVSDNNYVDDGSLPELWVYRNNAWVKIDTASGYGTSSIVSDSAKRTGNDWEIKLDSTKIDAASGSSTDSFLAVRITDKAGNTTALPTGTPSKDENAGYYYLAVNQDNDRPVIKFSEVTGATGYTSLYACYIKGNISDLDGVKTFKVSPVAKTESEWESYDCSSILKLSSSGDFTYTPSDSKDGDHDLYFYIEDKSGTKFWTAKDNEKPLTLPYVVYATDDDTETKVSNTEKITFKSDKTPPSIDTLVCGVGATAQDAVNNAVLKLSKDITMGATTVAGGNNRKFIAFAVKASDTNGISKVIYTKPTAYNSTTKVFTYSDIEQTTAQEKSYTVTEGEDSTEYKATAYFFDAIDISGFTSAANKEVTPAITFTAVDGSTLEREQAKSMVLSIAGPEVNVDSPNVSDPLSAGNTAYLSGSVTAQNNVSVSDLKYIYVNNKVYDTLDSAGASGRSAATETGYTFPESVTDSQKIAYIKAQAASHTDGHPEVFGVGDMETNYTASKFKWLLKGHLPDENTVADIAENTQTGVAAHANEISYVKHDSKGIYDLPIWILATDELGNETLYKHEQRYNPYGDRAITKITYPEAKAHEGETVNYAELSGTIRVSGTAEDNGSVGSVYIQIDANGDGSYNASDVALLKNKYSVYTNTSANATKYGIESTNIISNGKWDSDPDFWGIKATGTASWYITLNKEKELHNGSNVGTDAKPIYKVNIRAVAIDDGIKLGTWSDDMQLRINPNAPKIGTNVPAYILDAAGKRHAVTNDMWLKGETYLCVSVQHSAGIADYSYTSAVSQAGLASATAVSKEKITSLGNGTNYDTWKVIAGYAGPDSDTGDAKEKGYVLKIPLETSAGSGTRVIKVWAQDATESGLHSEEIYTFNYDNDAPSINKLENNGLEWTTTDYNSVTSLQNSQGSFSVGGGIEDGASGFNMALWYFYRDENGTAGKNRRIYDPVKNHKTEAAKSRIDVTDGTADTNTASGYKLKTGISEKVIEVSGKKYPVYGVTYNSSTTIKLTRTNTTSLTLSAVDEHISNGSAVYINGSWLLLKDSTDNKTFSLSAEVPVTETEAFFPYAKVIDSGAITQSEKCTDWSELTFSNDDGDRVIESCNKSGSIWSWDASFRCDYIPDGNVTFVILALDNSGNITATSRTGKVQNNAPRLAKLNLATDLNGDGKYVDSEFETYDIYTKDNYQSDYDLTTANYGLSEQEVTAGQKRSSFIVKDTLAVCPEFTGGNGEIAMVYKLKDENVKSANKDRSVKTSDGGAKIDSVTGNYATGNTTFTATGNKWLYKMTNEQVSGTDGDGTRHISFTFWDSTEECVQGTNSQSCYVQLTDLNIDVTDDIAPKVNIEPFFWTGKGFAEQTVGSGNASTTVYVPKNSLYYTFDAATKKPTETVNGHIELSGDLPLKTATPAGAFDSTATSGEYDIDPKVSGKIVVRGTSYDDVRLDSIWVSFDNFTISGMKTDSTSIKGTGTTTTTSTVTNGTYSYTTALGGDGKTYYLAAKFNGSAWTTVGDIMSANYWGFKIVSDGVNEKVTSDGAEKAFFDQRGHRVAWELYLDTAHLTNVTGTDKSIRVMAVDARGTLPSSTTAVSATAEQTNAGIAYTAHNTPAYKVDVVPYISKLSTAISESAGEEFARSALGKYIVRGQYMVKNNNKWENTGTETVSIYGFNLKADSTNGNVTIGSTSGIKTTYVAETTKNSKTIPAHLTFPVGTGTSSGKLFITVNSVESLNNKNKNPTIETGATAPIENTPVPYNSQANGKTNDRLTDDVELWVWDMNYFLNETNITSPMMKMGKDSKYYMSYGRGIQNMYVNQNGSGTSVDFSYNKFHNTNVAFDDNGSIYAVAMNTDRIHNDSSRFVLYTPSTANAKTPTAVTGSNTSYVFSSDSKRHLELAYNGGTGLYNINRAKNPKLTTSTNGNNTYIAMSYYDDNNSISPVKFRYGTRNGATISGGITGQIGNGVTSSSSSPSITMTESNNPNTTDCSAKGYHIVAGDNGKTDGTNYTFKGGQYTAVGLIPNGNSYIGVIAWYDANARRVCYSYNTAPETATAATDSQWQQHAVYLDKEYTGWHVDLTVDDNKGIHIAYYNSASGDLKYAYIPKYDKVTKDDDGNLTGGATVVTVDSYLSVGTNITINTRKQGSNYVPYIYYYNASSNQTPNSIKVAWRKDFTGDPIHGVVDDKFTGAWESMTIPTVNIPVEATVCGGVPSTSTTVADNKTVFLGYMSDVYYEKASIKGDVTAD